MLPTRWSHLIRHGLLGTTLLGAASSPAAADPCDSVADGTIALVIGFDVSPGMRFVGGIEGRRCLSDNTEALVRLELGRGTRLIAGVRARPLEKADEDHDAELLGVEGGIVLDMHARFGAHLAATYGSHSAYLSLQGHLPVTDSPQPSRVTVLGGIAPWTLSQGHVVEGRPLIVNGRMLRPRVAMLPAATSAEARAVRAHFVSSAQLELSSVWTFLRLAAELAAVGAPPALIAAALDAADDEVRHAASCAEAAGNAVLSSLPLTAARPRFAARTPQALATLAAEAWCEGCLNETAAAEEARLAAGDACGPVAAMLAAIARDETNHAELSWAVLAWVVSVSPGLARDTLAGIPSPSPSPVAVVDPALARHGVPTAPVTAAARAHAESTARSRRVALFA